MTVLYQGMEVGVSYIHLCQALQQSPFTGIVTVTASGRISFSNGKRSEVLDLFANVVTKGFTPSRKLLKAIKRLED